VKLWTSSRQFLGIALRAVHLRPTYEPWHERARESKRTTSYPLLSGDTFRTLASVKVETPRRLEALLDGSLMIAPDSVLFAKADIGHIVAEAIPPEIAQTCTLLVGNGDFTPKQNLAMEGQKFRRVFATNWLEEMDIVQPLPLGIDNAWRRGSKYVETFINSFLNLDNLRSSKDRTIDLLLCFNDSTNLDHRRSARIAASSFGGSMKSITGLTFSAYHDLLTKSLFVVSPPGVGHDCFRTWEAIYAGAIPIVQRSSWAFDHLQLPVLVSKNWEDTFQLIQENPKELYEEILQRLPNRAHADDIIRSIDLQQE
jgi:hypothetical protein